MNGKWYKCSLLQNGSMSNGESYFGFSFFAITIIIIANMIIQWRRRLQHVVTLIKWQLKMKRMGDILSECNCNWNKKYSAEWLMCLRLLLLLLFDMEEEENEKKAGGSLWYPRPRAPRVWRLLKPQTFIIHFICSKICVLSWFFRAIIAIDRETQPSLQYTIMCNVGTIVLLFSVQSAEGLCFDWPDHRFPWAGSIDIQTC